MRYLAGINFSNIPNRRKHFLPQYSGSIVAKNRHIYGVFLVGGTLIVPLIPSKFMQLPSLHPIEKAVCFDSSALATNNIHQTEQLAETVSRTRVRHGVDSID